MHTVMPAAMQFPVHAHTPCVLLLLLLEIFNDDCCEEVEHDDGYDHVEG